MTWNTTRNCTICSETPFKVPKFSTRNRTPGTDVASHLYVPNYLFSLNHFSPPTFPSVCPSESEREREHFPYAGKVWTFPAARSLVIYFSFTTSRKQHLLWPFARVFRFAGNIIPADGSRVFLRFRKTWSLHIWDWEKDTEMTQLWGSAPWTLNRGQIEEPERPAAELLVKGSDLKF